MRNVPLIRAKVQCGDCLKLLPKVDSRSMPSILSDPPYPEIDRAYGRLSEAEWMQMMKQVVLECRRVLTPKGSAVFVLQPNSRRVGTVRPWLWDFLGWCAREWNIVQDCYWANPVVPPNVHSQRRYGLMRPCLKYLVWLGDPDCYRNQDEVLLPLAESTRTSRRTDCDLQYQPSGLSMRSGRCLQVARERGGSTPMNLLRIANSNSRTSAGALGHGAGTPLVLADWWIRYITRPGDTVLDPFAGTASIGVAAVRLGRHYLGFEKMPEYWKKAQQRLRDAG